MLQLDKLKVYSPTFLRVSLSLVFLWFGVNQLINPESFLGYVPQWFYQHSVDIVHAHPLQMLHSLPLKPHFLIMGNGVFETVVGTFLLLGLFTRLSALLLSVHLALITLGLGYNDIAVRDFGLVLATIAVFLNGIDMACLDNRLKKRVNNKLLHKLIV